MSLDPPHQHQSQYQYQYSPKINTGTFPLKSPSQQNPSHRFSSDILSNTSYSTATSSPSGYSKSAERPDTVTGQLAHLSLDPRGITNGEKMGSICRFLSHLVNLRDPEIMLQKTKDFQYYKAFEQQYNMHTHSMDGDEALFTTIGPHFAIPFDLWLRDEICIKDIKVKITMLKEINGMIGAELKDLSNKSTFEVTLNYYGKLLNAYNFYEIPTRTSTYKQLTGNGNGGLHNQIEEELEFNRNRMSNSSDFEFGQLEKPFYRNHSNQSNDSSPHVGNSNNNNNNGGNSNRASTSSVQSKKRLSSFLTGGSSSHHNNKDGPNVSASSPDLRDANHRRSQLLTPSTPPQPQFKHFSTTSTAPVTSHGYQQQDGSPTPKGHYDDPNVTPTSSNNAVNNLLSKLRLYNKMKRNRELASSVNSTTSHQSYSGNRSSVTTTASGGSRRRSLGTNIKHLLGGGNGSGSGSGSGSGGGGGGGNGSPTGDASSFDSSRTLMPPDLDLQSSENVVFTNEEKLENCKDKHEYYCQVDQLIKESKRILKFLFNSNDSRVRESTKIGKLVEFITAKVFKFILIDAVTMILTYCDLKCCNFKLI